MNNHHGRNGRLGWHGQRGWRGRRGQHGHGWHRRISLGRATDGFDRHVSGLQSLYLCIAILVVVGIVALVVYMVQKQQLNM